MLKEIEQRQSIRKYKNTLVEKEKIVEILKAAMNAPTARNTQEWKFKVITNKTALNDIVNLSPYTSMMKEAPCAILVIADLNKAISVEYGLINCSAAIENILIEAVNQGLGTCWCGIAPIEKKIKDFKNYFKLTENEYPVGIVAIGYSNENKPLVDRFNPLNITYLE
ncbi:nitroreductase family protein [Thomasclavelia cocleata]|jgi:nitroreductase|uniref:nitroreductase family protein n=1 Tax=Thomasclavelia cocleata TaxID=69824 RepID=UPI00241C840B|nr:nitroreductase family protein [Thomasclavelia cocleata]MCI9631603.1 nitroreductase family protein [Thomasclavelia cocleata]